MKKLEVGDEVRFTLTHGDGTVGNNRRSVTGTVTWIHPKGRFVTVCRAVRGGVLRECLLTPHMDERG